MANTLLIDGNSLGNANHNATALTVGTMQTQAIFGMVKSMKSLTEAYPGWNLMVLWDGRAQWRFDLYPEYKSKRKPKDEKQAAHKEAYKLQQPFIRKALQLLGVRQLLVSSAEADDMAGLMSKKLSASGSSVVLVSGDQDWLQLVNPNVMWFDPIRDYKVGMGNFFEFTGYKTPEQFLEGKILQGDGSDDISGVGGIGEKGAPEFIAEFGSVANFYALVESGRFKPKLKAHTNLLGSSPHTKDEWEAQFAGDKETDKKAFKKHMDEWPGQGRLIYDRNRKLMSLLDVPTPKNEDIQVIAPTFNPDLFRALCEKLAFNSILREFDDFLTPFQELTLKKAA